MRIVYVSLLMMAMTFGVFEWELARGSRLETARTAAVNMLVVGELVYLFNVRRFTAHALARDTLTGNPVALWASVVLIGLQLLFTYAPPLQKAFQTTALDAASWLLIALLGRGEVPRGGGREGRAAAHAAALDVNGPLRAGPGMRGR